MATCDTLAEAESYVIDLLGGEDFGTWEGDERDVVCYHESDELGCGGFAIRATA